MKALLATLAAVSAVSAAANEVILYEGTDLRGRNVTISRQTPNLGYLGFENRASSLYVIAGTWEFCTEPYFRGECRVFREGQYPVLPRELRNKASSAFVN